MLTTICNSKGEMHAKAGNERDGYVNGLFEVGVRNENIAALWSNFEETYTIVIKHEVSTKRKYQTHMDIAKCLIKNQIAYIVMDAGYKYAIKNCKVRLAVALTTNPLNASI